MREKLKDLILAIGGEQRLKEILLHFYQKMSADVMIGFFFENKNLTHIAGMQAQFMLSAAGLAPTAFQGKGPATAHTALPPILIGHFDRRLVLLKETLTEERLSLEWIQAWVQFEEGFREMVVSKK